MLTVLVEYGFGEKTFNVAALPLVGDELIIVMGPTVRVTHVKVYAWGDASTKPDGHPDAFVRCTFLGEETK